MPMFFYGVSATASFLAALLFLRFWRECEDRLFACFALAFALLTVNWVALSLLPTPEETRPFVYMIRIGAFRFTKKNKQRLLWEALLFFSNTRSRKITSQCSRETPLLPDSTTVRRCGSASRPIARPAAPTR